MLQISLAQVRANAARLVATVLAIVIAVGFVVATLVLDATSTTTLHESVAAEYVGVDTVAGVPLPRRADGLFGGGPLDGDASGEAALKRIQARPDVAAASLDRTAQVQLRVPGTSGRTYATVQAVSPEPSLRWERLLSGRLPTAPGEVAVANQVDAEAGTDVTLLRPVLDAEGNSTGTQTITAHVVGVVDQRGDPRAAGTLRLFATDAQTRAWGSSNAETVRAIAVPGVSAERLTAELSALVGENTLKGTVTGAQAADLAAKSYTGDAAGLTAIMLAFAAVAAVVSMLVIANTFAVLLAQRTRELALLRCVGATARQVRRGVLTESAVIGVASSVIGIAAGIGVAAGLVQLSVYLDSPIPVVGLDIPVKALFIGLALGTGITVLAALTPARRATRVRPLAALRPVEDESVRSRSGLVRLALGLVLMVPGLLVLFAGAGRGLLPIGVLGGLMSFLGVVLLARRAVPWVVGLVGGLTGRFGGVPGETASANAVRNPARTAATALALVIGVTLTTTMVVGAASTRASAGAILDQQFSADVAVYGGGTEALPSDLGAQLQDIDGVAATLTARTAQVLSPGPDGPTQNGMNVEAFDPVRAAAVLRSATTLPARGTLDVPDDVDYGRDGSRIVLVNGDRRLPVTLHEVSGVQTPRLALADLQALAPEAVANVTYVRLEDAVTKNPATVVGKITDLAGNLAPDSVVSGPALERAAFDRVLDIMLLVVTALLAVAVLIAIIGVGNTIALSVVERRQEIGLLRALGLTRRQVRTMLLWEAALVAGVASVLGVGLGTMYGVTGTASVLAGQSAGAVTVDIPWVQVLVIVVVATGAGALASVLPARRATRTSPVEAIAA